MQRKFLTNLAFLLALNLLVKPIWLFVFDIEVQERVGEESFGIYFALINFSFLFNILPDLGIANFNSRNIAMHNQLLQKHVPNLISLKLLLGVVYISVAMVLGLVLGYTGLHIELLIWLAISQFLISFVQYLRSNLQGLHLFKQDSIVSVLDRTLMMVFCGTLLWGGVTTSKFDIRWYVWLQAAAYAITALVAFVLVMRKAGKFRFQINWPFSIMILKKSLPFALLFILMSLYNRTDAVMLERMLEDGATQAGIYAKAYRLLDAVNMFALLFAGLLLPLFARMIKLKQGVAGLVSLSFKLLITISLIGATACFFYSEELMAMLYTTNAAAASPIFQLLMLSFVAISTTYVFGTLLTANNNLKLLNSMALAGVVLNIGLNFYLIPIHGAYGAAVATVATQFLTALAQVILAQFVFKFKVNYRLLFGLLGFAAGLWTVGYFSSQIHPNWLVNFLVLLGAGAILALVTGMINPKAMLSVLKYREESEDESAVAND
jgi:O-antigen/teichoic acid export membrane protein